MSRRVVVLSRGGRLLPRLLAAMDARGARPHALVLYVESAAAQWRALPMGKRLLALPLLPLRWARRRFRGRLRREARALGGTIVRTGPLNGARMEADLRALSPDVLVLAGCGLVDPRILAIPREGTVNVHPALLPWVRGNGALENSILREIPLGCSAFWVDPGIDTGRVIERRLVPLSGGEPLAELQRGIAQLWIDMTADLAAAAAAGPLPAGTSQPERFPLFRAVRDPEQQAAVAAAVAAGAANALFDRWSPFCDPRLLSLGDAASVPVARTDGTAASLAANGEPR